MARPLRADIPIYLAAVRPKAVEQAFEIADGWLPIFWSPAKAREVFPLDRVRDGFDVAPCVPAVVTDDVQSGRDALKSVLLVLHRRHGREVEELLQRPVRAVRIRGGGARRCRSCSSRGSRSRRRRRCRTAFVDEVALIGSVERIRERLDAFRESGATTLLISTRDAKTLRGVAEAAS